MLGSASDEASFNLPSKPDVLEPELVFGLVGPLGCNIDAAQEALVAELMKVGYKSIIVHLTSDIRSVIPEINAVASETYDQKITLMNDVVASSTKKDFLARLAVAVIAARRASENSKRGLLHRQAQEFQSPSTAYIIRQLKRQQEVATLTKVYDKKFVQVSIAVSESDQFVNVMSIVGREHPELSQSKREDEARRLIDRDRDEAGVDFGQELVDVYHSADVFVGSSTKEITAQVSRFIEAFFGSNLISPTKDEFGSQLAKTASLRTLDLSRQVGAAIMTSSGDIISLGSNEVPKAFGGNYWSDDDSPQRDIERGVEPNKLETMRLVHNFVYALAGVKRLNLKAEEILRDAEVADALKDAFVSDITEFGRITHAEMSALLDAARLGRSTAGSTVYVTTFPCHNCAKHLVAAGVVRIVYIEPYTKSKAFELSGDALTISKTDKTKVLVEHFVGIAPKRFRDIFEKSKKRRDDFNRVKKWQFETPTPMISNKTGTHTSIEQEILVGFQDLKKLVVEGLKSRSIELPSFDDGNSLIASAARADGAM